MYFSIEFAMPTFEITRYGEGITGGDCAPRPIKEGKKRESGGESTQPHYYSRDQGNSATVILLLGAKPIAKVSLRFR
jgi:hypothetical protein